MSAFRSRYKRMVALCDGDNPLFQSPGSADPSAVVYDAAESVKAKNGGLVLAKHKSNLGKVLPGIEHLLDTLTIL